MEGIVWIDNGRKTKDIWWIYDGFSKLSTEQKCTEILDKQEVIIAFLMKYARELNLDYQIIRGIKNDVEETNEIDIHLNKMMVCSENVEELLGLVLTSFLEKLKGKEDQ